VGSHAFTLMAPLGVYPRAVPAAEVPLPAGLVPSFSDGGGGHFSLLYEEATTGTAARMESSAAVCTAPAGTAPAGAVSASTATVSASAATAPAPAELTASGVVAPPAPPPLRCVRRVDYRFGKAIVFAAGFKHSTEPGRAAGEAPHAYLCFTFGTDRLEDWPLIAQTIDCDHLRLMSRPDGVLVLSSLGRQLAEESGAAVAG
jgi:hypothetical protein